MSSGILSAHDELWQRIGHSVFINVDLEAIASNVRLLKKNAASMNTGFIAVIKSNAYGHGAIEVARYLTKDTRLADRLAVATIPEAVQLRRACIEPSTPIHIFGNVPPYAMDECLQFSLIPTVSTIESIRAMSDAMDRMRSGQLEVLSLNCSVDSNDENNNDNNKNYISKNGTRSAVPLGAVNIKIDTGMSRNGCQPQELPKLIQTCTDLGVPIDAIFSHFCNHEEIGFSEAQLDVFNDAIQNYRNSGYKFHLSNSGGVLRGLGTDLDFIRPGIAIYGQSPESDVSGFAELGFRPALSIKGTPTLVKKCLPETRIGYGSTYTCQAEQWIGTFPIGYGDGFRRSLGDKKYHIIRDKTGEKCPVVGRVSMDAITVGLPCQPDPNEIFTLVSADYDDVTSVSAIARQLGTIEYEILTGFAGRLPRVFSTARKPIYAISGPKCLGV